MIHALRCAFTSRLFPCFLTAVVLLGCASAADKDTSTRTTTQVARLGRSFTLKAGRQVTLEGKRLRIKFVTVEEDSRCPSDVTCIWAGNAAVRLEVSTRGKDSESLTLNTTGGTSREMLYHGYKLRLVGLNPYPRSTQKISASDYTATLLVTKE